PRRVNGITDVREITLSARIFDKCGMTSSVIPSAKYSVAGSALRFRNGRTATDGGRGGAGAARASVNAAIEAKRSAGALARPLLSAWTTPGGTVGSSRRIAGTGSTIILAISAWAVGPV